MSPRVVVPGAALALIVWSLPVWIARAQAEDESSATARVVRDDFQAVRSSEQVRREESDRAAAANVGDSLEQAQGVVVQRTSSGSATPIVRGLTGHRVLLMVDELRLNDALTRPGGSALLNLVDPESVERIEVIRGPASVLYGSDALGGVVLVHTAELDARPGVEPEVGATAYARGASAEQVLRVQAAIHGVSGGLGGRISGGRGHAGTLTRGGSLGDQPFTGHDDWSFASRLEAAPSSDHRVSLSHQSGHLFDMPRTDVSTAEDRQETKQLDRDSAVLGYRGRFAGLGELRLRAHAGMVVRREWRRRQREGETSDERDRVLGYHAGVGAVTSPFAEASLEVGVDAVLEDIGSGSETADAAGVITRERGRYVDGSRYDSYALYALWSQALSGALTMHAGARGTLVDARAPIDPLFAPEIGAARRLDRRLFGVVGSLGTRYAVSTELAFVASLLGGFRAPNLEDFQALGGGARGFTVPNPDLDEERSWTAEAGVSWDDRVWQLETHLFGSLLTGLIERVPSEFEGMTEIDGARVQTPENASRSVLLGAETSLVRRTESGLYGGVSAQGTWGETQRPDAEGDDVTEPASKVPPPTAALQLGFDPSGSAYWLQLVLTGALPQSRLSESDRNDVRICEQGPDDCSRAPGWTDLTFRAGLRLDAHLLIALAIENLVDVGYKTYASGAYAPARNFALAVRGTM